MIGIPQFPPRQFLDSLVKFIIYTLFEYKYTRILLNLQEPMAGIAENQKGSLGTLNLHSTSRHTGM